MANLKLQKHLIGTLHKTNGSTECAALEWEGRFSYPGVILVYPEKLDSARLRHALARVLDDFPQYAGKFFVNGVRLWIQHGEGTVSFATAHSAATIEELAADIRAGRVQHLEPQTSVLKTVLGQEAALLIKLTEARDGCVLAVGWNHAVGDTHSTMLLMRAWTNAYAGLPHEKPLVVSDRDAYLRSVMPDPKTVRSSVRISNWFNSIAFRLELMRPAARIDLAYSTAQLAAIHRKLNSAKRVTINDALCAHVYSVLRHLSGATETTNLCLVVNYRKRLGLSSELLGNMISILAQPVGELDTPGQIAAGIRESLEDYATKHADYHATMRVVDATRSFLERGRLVSRHFKPGSGDIFITNWTGFGWTELAFNQEKPRLFHPILIGTRGLARWVMLVYDLPQQGLGVAIGLPPAIARRCLTPEGQASLLGLPMHNSAAHDKALFGHETVHPHES